MRASLSFFPILLISMGATAAVLIDVPEPRFEAETIDDEVAIGYGVAVGDVDGDGRPDILLADKKQFVWYRNPDWQRFVMVEDLTERDNVAIDARDLDGDGRVEVAVGAQWNPGETSDPARSGSVHYLIRPEDPTQRWEPVQLHHEPTVHRLRWARLPDGTYSLVVLPLHGRGNRNGEGAGVRVLAYRMPENPKEPWQTILLDDEMHMTHNFEVVESENAARLLIGGREGVRTVTGRGGTWETGGARPAAGLEQGAGEVRYGNLGALDFITTIEPMHGSELVVYVGDAPERQVLDRSLAEGHALAAADLLGIGRDQIVVGWRNPNAEGKTGIKLFVPLDASGSRWEPYTLDDEIAAEDLKVADLNADGRLDIVAAGRASHDLKIYWNRTESGN